MHTFAATLRTIVGVLSAFGLLYPVFLLLVSPLVFSPFLFAGIPYFALAFLGVFALPTRRRYWLGAVVLHLGAAVLLWALCPLADHVLLVGMFAIYVLLWWLAVGLASLAEPPPGA